MFGHGEILWIGQFREKRVTRGQSDAPARRLDDLGVVGGFSMGPGGIGGDERIATRRLRCLRAPQVLARDGLSRFAGRLSLQGVGDGEGGQGEVGVGQRPEQGEDHVARHEGASRIVDHHRLSARALGQGCKACLNR